MSKSVKFSLSFLKTLNQWESNKKDFDSRSKARRLEHSFLDDIFNHCVNSQKVKDDNEIDQKETKKRKASFKRTICRFLNENKSELCLGFPIIQNHRRSRDNLDTNNAPPAKKQTRFQAQLCQAENCEWKNRYDSQVEENSSLRNEIESLKTKMDQFQSQSTQKSSQSQPWAAPTIELLQSEQIGFVTRFSVEMIRLAIFLLVSCNLSARVMPMVMLGILNAVNIKNMRLPKYGYFNKIRSMLPNLNRSRMVKFCENAEELSLCFDESSYSKKQGGILALSLMNEKAENQLIAMIEHNEKPLDELQHTFDVRFILEKLRNIFGDSFDSMVLKIKVVLSDDSHHARATRKLLRDELDRLYPNGTRRKELRCLIHVANLAESFILKKLPLLLPFLRKVGPLLSKPKNASTDSLYNVWNGHKIIYGHGARFFVHGDNAVACFASYDKLIKVLSKYQNASINAAQLLEMTKNPEFYHQLAVMARLSSFVHNIWSMITVKQTKRSLIENIEKIKSQLDLVESDTFSLDDVAEYLVRNHQVDRDATQRYVSDFANNVDVQTKTKEVFLYFTGKLFDLMEPYLSIDESIQDDDGTDNLDRLVDPTNLGIERSFGIMKFYEARFINLSFGCLSAITISKFNDLPKWLESFPDEELLVAHGSVRTNQSVARDAHEVQQGHLRVNTERRLDKVFNLNFFFVFLDLT